MFVISVMVMLMMMLLMIMMVMTFMIVVMMVMRMVVMVVVLVRPGTPEHPDPDYRNHDTGQQLKIRLAGFGIPVAAEI